MEDRIKQIQAQIAKYSKDGYHATSYFSKQTLENILNFIENDKTDYTEIEFNQIREQQLSFKVWNKSLKQKSAIVILSALQPQKSYRVVIKDETNTPKSIFESELDEDMILKEYDFEEYNTTVREFNQEQLKKCERLDLVKQIHITETGLLLNVQLSMCTSLLSFSIGFVSQQQHFGPNVLSDIADALANCPNLKRIRYSNLNNQQQSQSQEEDIFIQKTTQIKGLQEYQLKISNITISEESQQKLGAYLSNLVSVEYLSVTIWTSQLSHNSIQYIFSNLHLCKSLKNLYIDLEDNHILSEGLDTLGKYLEKCQGLQKFYIDIWNNSIEGESVREFTDSLKKIKSLKLLELYLSGNTLDLQSLSGAITNISQSSVKELFLNIHEIKDNGSQEYLKSLRNLHKVTSIQYQFSMDAMIEQRRAIQAFQKNKRLVLLSTIEGDHIY